MQFYGCKVLLMENLAVLSFYLWADSIKIIISLFSDLYLLQVLFMRTYQNTIALVFEFFLGGCLDLDAGELIISNIFAYMCRLQLNRLRRVQNPRVEIF